MPPTQIGTPEADEYVRLACDGDSEAFALLFRLTVPMVSRVLYARGADSALIEDVSSDAYLRAWRSVGRFSGSSRDFQAWVVRIARNLFLDHVKSAKVRWETVTDELPVSEAKSNTEKFALGSVEVDELRDALGELTDEQQEVILLRFIEQRSLSETAELTGRNEGAVKALQHRALKSLARVLDSRGFEWP